MTFKINGLTYKIVEVSKEKLKEEFKKENPLTQGDFYIYGKTNYVNHTISINKELCLEEKLKTLKHELCHCWMWNTSNANQENYNEEHICEMVACNNDFIHDIAEKYKNLHKM